LSIKRLYIKELLSFDEVKLEFHAGLIVLTGPSGAGKSVLMQSVLSNFGYEGSEAKVCEVTIDKPYDLESDEYELDDELVIRSLKKDRTRLYINDQNISKKALNRLFAPHVHYLSVRDSGGFESGMLLGLLDRSSARQDRSYEELLGSYLSRYRSYRIKLNELETIKVQEKRLSELIEFTAFEIEKIKAIDPKIGEDEELLKVKHRLSRIDKINDALSLASDIFQSESQINNLFRLLEKDAGYFGDTMNRLRIDFEEAQTLSEELSEIDIEEVLGRLEKIAGLKSRYGGVAEAIEYRKLKEKELAGYETIEKDKSALESWLAKEYTELVSMARNISKTRQKEASTVEQELKSYLSQLKLPEVQFVFSETGLGESGIDIVDLKMGRSTVSMLSGGEFNRLRLALMAAVMQSDEQSRGIVILDEIDANVSGDESIAIAQMVSKLSLAYQIFAISHQAHLSAKADQHILITKNSGLSYAKTLENDERITEIARIIGGENAEQEAIAFAKLLRKN